MPLPQASENFPLSRRSRAATSRRRGCLVGLDIGSSAIKAAAFDEDGRQVDQSLSRLAPHLPDAGRVERDCERTWLTAVGVLRAVSRGRKILAVGVTGCGNGAVFLDGRNQPLLAGILSSDQRAKAFMPEGEFSVPYQQSYPGQTRWLLRWFRAVNPSLAKRLFAVLAWKDFVRLRLTNRLAADFTDAGAAGLMDLEGRRYFESDSALAPLLKSTDPAGTVTRAAARLTGLAEGTPVFVGCIDCEAAALGSGLGRAGELSIVAGSWSINQTYSRRPRQDPGIFLCNLSARADRWLLLDGSPSSAISFDWAVRTLLGPKGSSRALKLCARTGSGGVVFLPHLHAGRGRWSGIGVHHGPAELLRAAMEGVVFAHRVHVEALKTAGMGFRLARLTGGISRSKAWAQLFADILGLRVEVPRTAEAGALGAALCAGVGLGVWKDLGQAQSRLPSPRAVYRPRTNYDRQFNLYQSLACTTHENEI